MILKFMLKLVKYFNCNCANMVKMCLTNSQCFEKNEIQNIFLSKNPTSFSFEEKWENSFFPIF